MKAEIITCFESNDERVKYVYEAMNRKFYDVKVISSNFSHANKTFRNNVPDYFKLIETKPYDKNLSVERINSHKQFAKDAFEIVRNNKPDLIWLMIPANSLLQEAKQYKKENNNVKIIVDVIDMWPESLPVSFSKSIFPLSIWKNIRKNNLDCADIVVSECNMYHSILEKEYSGNIETLYWAKDNKDYIDILDLSEDRLSLCYLGSINNIIDISKIEKIISTSDKPVTLHIIGAGEKKDEMINELSQVCEVIDHGIVMEEKEKSEILKRCHAGINIYKDNLYIGLTMKCIDYFRYGLPIINNIKGDTWKFVEEYNVGVNIDSNTILNSKQLINMRNYNDNIYDLYDTYFSKDVFMKKCREIINEVLK